jgi:signal transduction histidine kinase
MFIRALGSQGFHSMSEMRFRGSEAPRTLPEAALRTLRHEVGDFLQTVYATAAILGQRLPQEWELERRILGDMRTRGDACKSLIDLTHDLICPIDLNYEVVDFTELLAPVLAAATKSHPRIRMKLEQARIPSFNADSQRLTQVARWLLTDACESAAKEVCTSLSLAAGGREIQWCVQRDGSDIPAEQLEEYFGPGTTGYQGPESLAMILVGKIVKLHGGRIQASNPPEGGMLITTLLPINRTAIR